MGEFIWYIVGLLVLAFLIVTIVRKLSDPRSGGSGPGTRPDPTRDNEQQR